MALFPVGVSSFGALRGVTQYVTSAAVALQVRSLIVESRAVFAGGAVLSVNEGVRSRPDQASKLAAWQAYRAGGPWAPLAASPLYTSTHDEAKGSALDFGVTMPDGSNRAMTMSEQSWVVQQGALRGIRWTGRDFRPTPESWHFNGGFPASLPPLPADVLDAGAAPPAPEEDEMHIISCPKGQLLVDNGQPIALGSPDEVKALLRAGIKVVDVPASLFDRYNARAWR